MLLQTLSRTGPAWVWSGQIWLSYRFRECTLELQRRSAIAANHGPYASKSMWNWLKRLMRLGHGRILPLHLLYGQRGERAARKHLSRAGLKFLAANFRSERGEIDLIFRDGD